jgi:S-adenosylmethionine decarboxylase
MVEEQIARAGLTSVGAVHHAFPNAGFTSVICLTESHLSIHTWPEYGRVTFDVFLSNFSRVNDVAADNLVAAIKSFLGAGRYTEHRLNR